MSRVKDLQQYVHKVLKGMDDNQKRAAAVAHLHGVMDEILKDADVIHHSLGDPTKEVKEKDLERYEKLSAEFGFVV